MNRDALGKNIRSFIPLEQDEFVRSILPLRSFDDVEGMLCLMSTANGIVNKNLLTDYSNVYANGINALNAADEDRLIEVTSSEGGGELILATKSGQSIRFREEEVRLTKRPSKGVIGIRLDSGDSVIGMANLDRDIDRKSVV